MEERGFYKANIGGRKGKTMWGNECQPELDNRVEPERSLVLEIIRSGVRDLLTPKLGGLGVSSNTPHRRAKVRQDAFEWLFKEESHRVFSFPWCCDVVNLHPRILRDELKRTHPELIMSLENEWRKAA